VLAAADRVSNHPEDGQDRADEDDHDADGPDNSDLGDEADNEENDAENYHGELHLAGKPPLRAVGKYADVYLLRVLTEAADGRGLAAGQGESAAGVAAAAGGAAGTGQQQAQPEQAHCPTTMPMMMIMTCSGDLD
jgi:hypothetical protein